MLAPLQKGGRDPLPVNVLISALKQKVDNGAIFIWGAWLKFENLMSDERVNAALPIFVIY